MPAKKKSTSKDSSFETSIEELQKIIERMEDEETSLDEALTLFEAGVKLTRTAQKVLQDAEQKVQLLTEKDGDPDITDFEEEE